MKGERLPDGEPDVRESGPPPGSYWHSPHGWWECCTPNGLIGALTQHDVVEHEDGTITVSPSILCERVGTGRSWHGYLERGVWRKV